MANRPLSLLEKIKVLLTQKEEISAARKGELEELASLILGQLKHTGFAKVTFICTHNSRRSQLAQIWFWWALAYFQIENVESYSAGTERTALNHRMVSALQRYGFSLQEMESGANPKYLMQGERPGVKELILFSKKYADAEHPQEDFIAVMVCDQADADCPLVPGSYARVSLPYVDPKVADDTPAETKCYDEKVIEVGREIVYLVKYLHGFV